MHSVNAVISEKNQLTWKLWLEYDLFSASLAVSAIFILLMSGMILFQTSAIIHGGETNYISATVSLYVSIYNLFLSLLQLLGVFGGDD